jgi:hypothetical protein
MATGRDLVRRSMQLIGVLGDGETPSASQLTDVLLTLKEMLKSWSLDRLIVYNFVKEEFSLVAGTGSYTMGDGKDFNTSRPIEITKAKIKLSSDGSTVEVPVRELSVEEWERIIQRDLQSPIPTQLFCVKSGSYWTLNLYPVPSAANTLILFSTKEITEITADLTLDLPPGYERAIRYNLGIEIAPEFGRTPLPAEILKIADESKESIKRANIRPVYASTAEAAAMAGTQLGA